MPRIELEPNVEINYEDQGTGQTIIFIHGVWMSSRFFQKQMTFLSERYRVIAVDLRGHGQSSHVPYGHTIATYAADIKALTERLHLEDVILAGWSMGSFVIWHYIKLFGTSNLKAVAIVEESASDYRWPDWPVGLADFEGLCEMMTAVQTSRDAFVRDFIQLMFKESPSDADVAWMMEEITRLPESIASAILFDQTTQDYRSVLKDVDVPALLCFGRDEKLIPLTAATHLQENMPTTKLEIFEESGHCPFLEEPEKFNKVIDDFIWSLG